MRRSALESAQDGTMPPTEPGILTVNGGSSSIKFALFTASDPPQKIFEGALERIGQASPLFWFKGSLPADQDRRSVAAPDHVKAVAVLMDWLETRGGRGALAAVGHRVVHGGPNYFEPQLVTEA